MPAINFPSSPTPYQIYSDGTNSWQWNGTAWEAFTPNITSISLTDVTYDGGSATVTESVFLVSSSTIGGFPHAGDASIIGKLTTTDNIIAPLLVGTASFATNIFSAIEYSSSNDPSVTTNPTRNNSLWLNSSSGQLFVNSDRTSNANEWVNLSTGSNVAPGNTFYSFVTASALKVVSGAVTPLLVQLKDRFNKALNINTGQTIVITGSDGAYTSTVYSASGIFTASVTGPTKVTGSFRVSGSINGTLLTPITFTIVDPLSLNALGGSTTTNAPFAIPTSSGYNGHSRQLNGTGGPQLVSTLTTWESASTNGSNVLATTFDGLLYAWGNTGSLFGTGSTNVIGGGSRTPTRVGTGSFSSSVWVQHSIGRTHAAAIRNDGTLWTWGASVSGALGLGPTITTASVPARVGIDSDWVAVSCGNEMTLALKLDTTLWATGNNTNGQLGSGISGSDTNRNFFNKVIGDNWSPRIFAAADRTSHAIKNNGTLFGWGNNYSHGLIGNATAQIRQSPVPSQENNGLTDWVMVIPSRGNSSEFLSNAEFQVGPDQSLRYAATYGVAGTRFYGWGGYIQDFIHTRQQNFVSSNNLQTSSTSPVLDPFITTSANIYMLGRIIYEIDSTGSLNAWGNPSSAAAETNYGRTLPTASTITGLTTTPQNAQLVAPSVSSEVNNMTWGMNDIKVSGSKFRIASNYNFQGFAKGTVYNVNSTNESTLLVLGKKISGSSFPTASGAPTNLSFKIFTGSSNNELPRYAYIEFSSSLSDAEIQVSSSYPNATGSQFVTYIGPSSSRAYIAPPSYSINIKHDLRYFKNGGGSPTTASITANYCPGSTALLSGSCFNGQFTPITANGSCGVTVGTATCNGGTQVDVFTSCSFQYTYSQTSGPCTDYGFSGGTYYQDVYTSVSCTYNAPIDFSGCYY
jgi:hypothetical protein